MKVLIYDIETSRLEVRHKTFGLYQIPKAFSHKDIVQDWYILCICWKWLGESKVYSTDILESGKYNDDRNVVDTFRKVLEEADLIIAHNGDRFDIKKFTSRLIFHKLPPIGPKASIDTLKEVKKVATFTSHRLDYLGILLAADQKMVTMPGLWEACENGDAKAMRKMVKYCKQDVNLLEDVYTNLRPYFKTPTPLYTGHELRCPKCDSVDMIKHKPRLTTSGIMRQQYQCKSCGGYSTPRINSIVERSLLK